MGEAEHIRPRKKGRLRHRVLLIILGLLVAAAAACVALCSYWLQDLPSTDTITDYQVSGTTTVYASDKKTVLAKFYQEDRQPVDLDQISNNAVQATLATEDNRFYDHGAVDPIGIARAVANNVFRLGSRQGASTITQQLARNTILQNEAQESTFKRKVREAALAYQLEDKLSKDEILNLYLNTVNYGDNCYGIEAAAQHYFSKSAKDLTMLQAAALVGIPQSPNAYTPTVHPKACKKRRNTVLQRLADTGRISQDKADALKKKALNLNVSDTGSSTDGIYKYPYFTSYVRDQLLNDRGVEGVYEGGLKVYTTLDPALQEDAEAACESQYSQWYDTDAEIALVSIDPDNGYIKAMVGGKDYRTDQFNLVTQASRQAGSSFKAFTLAAAIEDGINPATMIDCTSPAQLGNWKVENIDNNNYGIRSIQSAFAVSSNTGFARLCQEVGADKVVQMAKRLGITSDLAEVDSITLGTSGVSPLEMCGAYATFANGGTQRTPTAITKVVDRNGQTTYEWKDEGAKALSDEVCYASTKVMETVFTQGTAVSGQLSTAQPCAGKTGTSEKERDHWLCGYTPQLSTTVWIGSRQEKSLPNLDPCYVWRTYMDAALAYSPIEAFPTADNPKYENAFNSSQAAKYGTSSTAASASTGSQSSSASSKAESSSSSAATESSSSSKSSYHYEDENGNVYKYDKSTGKYTYTDANGGKYTYNEKTNTYSFEDASRASSSSSSR